MAVEEFLSNRNVILPANSENILDRTCEQWRNSNKNRNYKLLLTNRKETAEISVTHNEDRRHGEFNTHLLKEREAGESSKQFNELLSEWMTEQR